MIEEKQKRINPLTTTWNIISSIGGAVGLVSFAEDWHDWSQFFVTLVEHYRTIVYWPFKVFPFEISSWVKDYLFLSILISSATYKSGKTSHSEKKYSIIKQEKDPEKIRAIEDTYRILFLAVTFILWPLAIFAEIQIIYFFLKNRNNDSYRGVDKESVRFWQWIVTILLIFIVCLFISVIMNRR
ncbi:MAG: hypothetical protein JXR03_06435 [Cyclobacteriaceae bacterium]